MLTPLCGVVQELARRTHAVAVLVAGNGGYLTQDRHKVNPGPGGIGAQRLQRQQVVARVGGLVARGEMDQVAAEAGSGIARRRQGRGPAKRMMALQQVADRGAVGLIALLVFEQHGIEQRLGFAADAGAVQRRVARESKRPIGIAEVDRAVGDGLEDDVQPRCFARDGGQFHAAQRGCRSRVKPGAGMLGLPSRRYRKAHRRSEKIYKCAMQSYSKLYADTGIVEVKRVRQPRRQFDPQALD